LLDFPDDDVGRDGGFVAPLLADEIIRVVFRNTATAGFSFGEELLRHGSPSL